MMSEISDLMANAIAEQVQQISIMEAKEEKFKCDLAEALLKYLNEGIGTAVLDDLRFTLDEKSPEWAKLSVWFKFEETKEENNADNERC